MCQATGKPPAFEKTLTELKPGEWFHDPNGETWMVINLPGFDRSLGDTMVANIGNGSGNNFGNALQNDELKGKVTPMRGDTRLGYDHRQRLYASTFLNDWYYDAPTPTPPYGEVDDSLLDDLSTMPG